MRTRAGPSPVTSYHMSGPLLRLKGIPSPRLGTPVGGTRNRQCRGFEVRTIHDIACLANFETKTTLESINCHRPFDAEIRWLAEAGLGLAGAGGYISIQNRNVICRHDRAALARGWGSLPRERGDYHVDPK